MKKLRIKLIIIHTAIMLLCGWGIWWLLQTALPSYYFAWYPSIPTLFFVIGIIFISVLDRLKFDNPGKTLNMYMLLRVSKVFVILIFAGIYILVVKAQLREFGLIFASFYLLYLGLETYYFYVTEKEIKKEKKRNNNE